MAPSKPLQSVNENDIDQLQKEKGLNDSALRAIGYIDNEALGTWPETLCHVDDILQQLKDKRQRIALLTLLLQKEVYDKPNTYQYDIIIPVPIYPDPSPPVPPPAKKREISQSPSEK